VHCTAAAAAAVQVRFPYSFGMYVIMPDAVNSVIWPLNMCIVLLLLLLLLFRCATPTALACTSSRQTPSKV
jgi:hypothetical protein